MLPKWLRVERIVWLAFASALALSGHAFAESTQSNTSVFSPASTPAAQEFQLGLFVFSITAAIFVVVGGLLTYVVIRYRARPGDEQSEPPQVYGSNQVELAWTVIPVLIVVVLFLTTARVIFAIQDAPKPDSALEVTVVGHQYWWEFRYPKQGIDAVNEIHVPLSSADHPEPTYLKLLSADTDHSFWVPRLSGKTDLIPNHPNDLWIEPMQPGLYLGQCAQFCGVQHANMLLRVYVDTPEQFAAWAANQAKPGVQDSSVAAGRHVFETQACMNCHTVKGTAATGRFGPDLTHIMSRDTIASGMIPNTQDNLKAWIKNPDTFKPGCLMPAMQLTDEQIDQVTSYLETLK